MMAGGARWSQPTHTAKLQLAIVIRGANIRNILEFEEAFRCGDPARELGNRHGASGAGRNSPAGGRSPACRSSISASAPSGTTR